MKIPKRIQSLYDDGLVDEVIGRLMSGKEADIYIVRCGSDIRCAKAYKDVQQRSFKKAVQYQEGRKVRNSRRARAIEKGSKFGRKQQENIWQNAEVDALLRVHQADVRVPKTYGCYDGVLLMDLITNSDGEVAPRLGDVEMSPELAIEDHGTVMLYVQRMLCAGIIHGDLSEFNVLIDDEGPVIIDLPQAVDASANNNAESMLTRDVNNVTRYYAQYAPELLQKNYAKEMWALYEDGKLTPDITLSGDFEEDEHSADVDAVLEEIKAAFEDEMFRQQCREEAENMV